jgi:hypothetical protein
MSIHICTIFMRVTHISVIWYTVLAILTCSYLLNKRHALFITVVISNIFNTWCLYCIIVSCNMLLIYPNIINCISFHTICYEWLYRESKKTWTLKMGTLFCSLHSVDAQTNHGSASRQSLFHCISHAIPSVGIFTNGNCQTYTLRLTIYWAIQQIWWIQNGVTAH